MKKVIVCCLLCVLLSSCGGQDVPDKGNDEVSPTPEKVEMNDSGFKEDSLEAGKDYISLIEGNLKTGKKDTELKDDNSSDVVVISDIDNWEHPVKNVLKDKGIPISKLELIENRTYPTFYVTLSEEIVRKEAIEDLIEEVAKANGFWDYSFVDESNNIKIEVFIDKENRKVKSYTINGEKTDFVKIDNNSAKYDKYLKFLNVEGEVTDFIQEDIDLDGNQEVVITIFTGEWRNMIYVLREVEDELYKIGVAESGGYSVYDPHLVKMKGKKHKYIAAFVTNGGGLSGFALYKVGENDVELIEYSASPTGAGIDYLVSSEDSDIYDGYVQNRYSYDVMYFNVTRYYKWNGESFHHVSTSVDVPEYPEDEEGVVRQFLKLSILDEREEKCDEVQKRLAEINTSGKALDFNKIWQLDYISFWISDISDDRGEFDIQINGDFCVITVPVQDKNIVFEMSKVNGRYCITNIKGDFVY